MNCRQSVAVFEVFNMSCNSIVFPYSHSLPQMSTSLHHQWNTTPVWGSWLLDGAVAPLSREQWRGWQGDMVWINWLLLHTMWTVSIFNTLSFHCIHGTQTVCSKSCPPIMFHCYVYLVCPLLTSLVRRKKWQLSQFWRFSHIPCAFSKWCPPKWLANSCLVS